MEQQHLLNDLSVDTVASDQLRDIARWAKFLSIISFIGCGCIVIAGIVLASIMQRYQSYNSELSGSDTAFSVGMIIGYVIVALVWFIPSLFLFQSSRKVKLGLDLTDQQVFNEGLIKLKACFRYWGIITIILLVLYTFVIVLNLGKL